jgi:hypothetical protein
MSDPVMGSAALERLRAEVDLHLERNRNAPNEAVAFAEHAQTLGLLKAVEIVKETPCSTT